MIDIEDGRSYNQVRPKLSQIEKMRRRVRRQDERCREMRAELDHKGWDERTTHTGPGRPKKLKQDIVRDQLLKLRRMMHELRRFERENGEEHVPLAKIRDPLVDNKTLHKVGRKQADELTEIDYSIRKVIDRIFYLVAEVDKHNSIFPNKKALGRTPISRLEKIQYQHDKLCGLVREVRDIEEKLDNTKLISRQIKLYFDEAREARKLAKASKNETWKRYYEKKNVSLYEEINSLKKYMREVDYQKYQLGLNVETKRIDIRRIYDYDLIKVNQEVGRIENNYGFLNK